MGTKGERNIEIKTLPFESLLRTVVGVFFIDWRDGDDREKGRRAVGVSPLEDAASSSAVERYEMEVRTKTCCQLYLLLFHCSGLENGISRSLLFI